MAFLRSALSTDAWPVIRGDGLTLRVPIAQDYGQWAELRAASREHLRPWEPEWARDELSRAAFRRRLRFYQKDIREELGFAFFIFRNDDDALVGGLTLSNIRRGVTQAVSIGYWTGLHFVGHGYMTQAVHMAAGFAFNSLRLHRIEAACLPNNLASIAVLERNGFRREGIARSYLKIDGHWQDHVLYALLSDDPTGGVSYQR
ncbi:MAG: GNAT family N-acetyltransferase [Hyphomicrobiaceae bacterium]